MSNIREAHDVDYWVKRYKDGGSITSIAGDVGLAPCAVTRALNDVGTWDVGELNRLHQLGEPIAVQARRLGVAPTTVRCWYSDRGLFIRGKSGAAMSRKARGEWNEGMVHGAAAARREQGELVRQIIEELTDRGIKARSKGRLDIKGEKRCFGVRVDPGPVAVKVVRADTDGGTAARTRSRMIDALDSRVCFLIVEAPKDSRPLIGAICNKIIALSEVARGNQAPLGQYAVIRSDGKLAARSCYHLDGLPPIESLTPGDEPTSDPGPR